MAASAGQVSVLVEALALVAVSGLAQAGAGEVGASALDGRIGAATGVRGGTALIGITPTGTVLTGTRRGRPTLTQAIRITSTTIRRHTTQIRMTRTRPEATGTQMARTSMPTLERVPVQTMNIASTFA